MLLQNYIYWQTYVTKCYQERPDECACQGLNEKVYMAGLQRLCLDLNRYSTLFSHWAPRSMEKPSISRMVEAMRTLCSECEQRPMAGSSSFITSAENVLVAMRACHWPLKESGFYLHCRFGSISYDGELIEVGSVYPHYGIGFSGKGTDADEAIFEATDNFLANQSLFGSELEPKSLSTVRLPLTAVAALDMAILFCTPEHAVPEVSRYWQGLLFTQNASVQKMDLTAGRC